MSSPNCIPSIPILFQSHTHVSYEKQSRKAAFSVSLHDSIRARKWTRRGPCTLRWWCRSCSELCCTSTGLVWRISLGYLMKNSVLLATLLMIFVWSCLPVPVDCTWNYSGNLDIIDSKTWWLSGTARHAGITTVLTIPDPDLRMRSLNLILIAYSMN